MTESCSDPRDDAGVWMRPLPVGLRIALLAAAAREGWKMFERALTAAGLEQATEIFITSATREVQPVST